MIFPSAAWPDRACSMLRLSSASFLILLVAVCGLPHVAGAQSGAQSGASIAQATAMSVVKPKAYVSLDPVPRGSTFEVAVVLSIARGYHMNSNKPLDEFLIPTTINAQFPAGFQPISMDYPQGQLLKFAFSPDKPLSVYSGSVALRAKIQARPTAKVGTDTIPFIVHYQVCNDSSCLPPVKVPVNVQVNVAPAGTKPHPANSQIFANPANQK